MLRRLADKTLEADSIDKVHHSHHADEEEDSTSEDGGGGGGKGKRPKFFMNLIKGKGGDRGGGGIKATTKRGFHGLFHKQVKKVHS